MSKTYPKLDRTKFPNAIDAFILFKDPDENTNAALTEYQLLISNKQFAMAAAFLLENPELEPYIVSADRLNHILHAVMAMEQYYMSDVRKSIMDIVKYRGVYNAKTFYEKFDVVVADASSTIAYMCIAEISINDIHPTNDKYWIPLTLQGQPGTGLTYAGTWNPTTNYQTSNWVYYNEVIWVSTISDNQGNEPTENSPYWFAIFRNMQHVICSSSVPENQYPGDLWLSGTNGTYVIKEKQNDGSYKDIYLDASVIRTSDGSSLDDYLDMYVANHTHTPESIGAAPADHTHNFIANVFTASDEPPTTDDAKKLFWVDTSNGNILKFYDERTSEWVPINAVWA